MFSFQVHLLWSCLLLADILLKPSLQNSNVFGYFFFFFKCLFELKVTGKSALRSQVNQILLWWYTEVGSTEMPREKHFKGSPDQGSMQNKID